MRQPCPSCTRLIDICVFCFPGSPLPSGKYKILSSLSLPSCFPQPSSVVNEHSLVNKNALDVRSLPSLESFLFFLCAAILSCCMNSSLCLCPACFVPCLVLSRVVLRCPFSMELEPRSFSRGGMQGGMGGYEPAACDMPNEEV